MCLQRNQLVVSQKTKSSASSEVFVKTSRHRRLDVGDVIISFFIHFVVVFLILKQCLRGFKANPGAEFKAESS